eukprot:UN31475
MNNKKQKISRDGTENVVQNLKDSSILSDTRFSEHNSTRTTYITDSGSAESISYQSPLVKKLRQQPNSSDRGTPGSNNQSSYIIADGATTESESSFKTPETPETPALKRIVTRPAKATLIYDDISLYPDSRYLSMNISKMPSKKEIPVLLALLLLLL